MGKKLRKFNRATHRDLGYFFVAMIFIYSLSGIAINHLDDWDPDYVVDTWAEELPQQETKESLNKARIKVLLKDLGIKNPYRKYYYPNSNVCKVFVKNGNVKFNLSNKMVNVEIVKRRTVFHSVNWLHYNPTSRNKYSWFPDNFWKWFSDIFAVSLILLSLSGMFILKGKNGLKWRGTILIGIGIIIPLAFLALFYF